tara:strand:- start:566 stop:3490 length:2925 start_codon:yes stop_codon:yes gene_type:complete
MKMPEFLIFAKALAIGFLVAEIWRFAFYLGANSALALPDVALWIKICVILGGALLCITYAFKRGAHVLAVRMGRSFRIDLLLAIGVGIWTSELVSPWFSEVHTALKASDPNWALAAFFSLSALLLSPLIQNYLPRPKKTIPQLYFITDEEIEDKKEDLFASETHAQSFAETVLASDAHPGLVFGIDAPWGAGKTSFINLAERHWANAEDRVIVCRFAPLRYASEPDLADRLIRDLSSAIKSKIFAPEFSPAASRYSRLIKGKADFSFFGFRLSLEPSQETADDLLARIDEVLQRIGRRVIIVIDDLDRLDSKAINNVLFATRRTFKLSQATYVLCYDTEVLVESMDEGARAREFLEKFVTVKLSLFVDSSRIRDFLQRDWQRAEGQPSTIPSDTMVKLGAVLNELAEVLDGDLAAHYFPLVGDLRKVKRFVNAILVMQIEKCDLGQTDFNKRDLINLMLLHLNFPGLFRRIYVEETEGRNGTFSVRRQYGEEVFKNTERFSELLEEFDGAAKFLLKQLFDVKTLGLEESHLEEEELRSRACFNHGELRNLEGYLKLIVRFVTPEPQETFVLYQDAVKRVLKGESIDSLLMSQDLRLDRGEHVHDQFWRVLVNHSQNFTRAVAEDAINTLVDYLPRYSVVATDDGALRKRSIYSLLRLLNEAGWGRTSGRHLSNSPENVMEIAWRIFGERSYVGNGLLQRLVAEDRGVLGWNDLMLFRLHCSADRQGQLYNLHSALIVHQDQDAKSSGRVNDLALMGMRMLSQKVFSMFKKTYINTRRNFFAEVDDTSAEIFVGTPSLQCGEEASDDQSETIDAPFEQHISHARYLVKVFVIYQLCNSLPPNGSGVGCGYYDESGDGDAGGIAKLMNDYVFDICFNPNINENNFLFFLDHCLSLLSSDFFSDRDEVTYVPSIDEISKGFDSIKVGQYWSQHRDFIRQKVPLFQERRVVTSNYIASYRDDLSGVFSVLDELVASLE